LKTGQIANIMDISANEPTELEPRVTNTAISTTGSAAFDKAPHGYQSARGADELV
jgi:hypothetical protein